MIFPDPSDMARAPLWENYIVCQALQATIGLIPEHAVVVAVGVDGRSVRLIFQVTQTTSNDESRINEIVEEFENLVGPKINVMVSVEVVKERNVWGASKVARLLYISQRD